MLFRRLERFFLREMRRGTALRLVVVPGFWITTIIRSPTIGGGIIAAISPCIVIIHRPWFRYRSSVSIISLLIGNIIGIVVVVMRIICPITTSGRRRHRTALRAKGRRRSVREGNRGGTGCLMR